jgi:hypothetical protein
MRFFFATIVSLLIALPSAAQPWYARGTFNAWGTENPLTDLGGGHWTGTITGLFPAEAHNWKIATADWSIDMPRSDSRVYTNEMGEINFHLWDNTSWTDGWFPNNARRVGYDDHQQFDWEVIGSFNGWPAEGDPNFYLTDMGNGLHRGTFTFNAGIYDFKFRRQGDWDVSIGSDFGNGAPNGSFAVASNGDKWTLELDLPNGRWRAFTDAAPTGPVGDHNRNGTVDAADYAAWRNDPASFGGQQGYDDWRAHFGESGAQATWLARSPQLGDQQLVAVSGNEYTLDLTDLAPSTDYDFRIARSDLSSSVPGSDMRVRANADGEIDLNFFELTTASWSDGWSPANTHRIGYEDHNEYDWELMGTLNEPDWTGGEQWYLTDMGNGLHKGSFTIETPGTYQFKFRQQGDWTTSIGDDFGNSAPNANFTSTEPNQLWNFELDLPNGRWRAYTGAGASSAAVPEPGAVVLMLLASLAMLGIARRRET